MSHTLNRPRDLAFHSQHYSHVTTTINTTNVVIYCRMDAAWAHYTISTVSCNDSSKFGHTARKKTMVWWITDRFKQWNAAAALGEDGKDDADQHQKEHFQQRGACVVCLVLHLHSSPVDTHWLYHLLQDDDGSETTAAAAATTTPI